MKVVKVKGTLVATKALQKIPDKWLLLLCFQLMSPLPSQLLLISQLDELLISFAVHNSSDSLTNEKNGNLITLLVEGGRAGDWLAACFHCWFSVACSVAEKEE